MQEIVIHYDCVQMRVIYVALATFSINLHHMRRCFRVALEKRAVEN